MMSFLDGIIEIPRGNSVTDQAHVNLLMQDEVKIAHRQIGGDQDDCIG